MFYPELWLSSSEHPEMLFASPATLTLQIPTKYMRSWDIQLSNLPSTPLPPKKINPKCNWNLFALLSLLHPPSWKPFIRPCVVTTLEIFPPPTANLLRINQLDHHQSILSIKQKAPLAGSLNIPSTYEHKTQTDSLTSTCSSLQETAFCS